MSEEVRRELLSEMGNALLGLESLSDGKTAKIDPNKVHGGDGAGVSLLRDKAPFDFYVAKVRNLVGEMKSRVADERRFVAPPATKAQEDFWFTQYEGTDYRTVANKENLEPMDVWRKRERMGLNPQNGKPLDVAA